MQRRSLEGEPALDVPEGDEAQTALLHGPSWIPGPPTDSQPDMAAAQRGMPREGQLPSGREDAHAVVGCRIRGWKQEGRLGQVGPAREGLHLLGRQPFGVDDDRHRVAALRLWREDVDLLETPHRISPCGWDDARRIALASEVSEVSEVSTSSGQADAPNAHR
jgi:hypothetical protein